MSYTFSTRVNGIPCQCEVTSYSKGSQARFSPTFGNWLPGEPEDFTFRILDRRGRPAPWLQKYVTPDVTDRLMEEFRTMQDGDYWEGDRE